MSLQTIGAYLGRPHININETQNLVVNPLLDKLFFPSIFEIYPKTGSSRLPTHGRGAHRNLLYYPLFYNRFFFGKCCFQTILCSKVLDYIKQNELISCIVIYRQYLLHIYSSQSLIFFGPILLYWCTQFGKKGMRYKNAAQKIPLIGHLNSLLRCRLLGLKYLSTLLKVLFVLF